MKSNHRHVRLTDEDHKLLSQMSNEAGVSMTALVGIAVRRIRERGFRVVKGLPATKKVRMA